MSPEAQRIAVLTAVNPAAVYVHDDIEGKFTNLIHPKQLPFDCDCIRLPNYLTDLNAIFAAIRAQEPDIQWAIFARLAQIVDAEVPAAFGTAAQYTEATLKTLNLWK